MLRLLGWLSQTSTSTGRLSKRSYSLSRAWQIFRPLHAEYTPVIIIICRNFLVDLWFGSAILRFDGSTVGQTYQRAIKTSSSPIVEVHIQYKETSVQGNRLCKALQPSHTSTGLRGRRERFHTLAELPRKILRRIFISAKLRLPRY